MPPKRGIEGRQSEAERKRRKRLEETPEQWAERVRKERERQAIALATETPEERAIRLASRRQAYQRRSSNMTERDREIQLKKRREAYKRRTAGQTASLNGVALYPVDEEPTSERYWGTTESSWQFQQPLNFEENPADGHFLSYYHRDKVELAEEVLMKYMLSTMHIMEGDCEKSPGCLAAEDAPQLKPTTNGITDSPEGNGTAQSPEEERAVESPDQSREEPPASPIREAASPVHQNGTANEEEGEERLLPPEEGDEQEEEEDEEVAKPPAESPPPDGDPPSVENCDSGGPPKESKDNSEPPVPNFVNPVTPSQDSVKIEKDYPCSEEDDKSNVPAALPEIKEPEVRRKRSLDADREGEASSSSESDSVRKRLKHGTKKASPLAANNAVEQLNATEDERENTIQRFINSCTQSVEEINQASEKLQKEMATLNELAKAKELEWNSILRLKKLKEEIYDRLQRKKRETLVLEGKFNDDLYNPSLASHLEINNMLTSSMMSSSPMMSRMVDLNKQQQRPILPKPFSHSLDHLPGNREGRNGHIIDVKSIIADYSRGVGCRRSRYPDAGVPRRGRRSRGDPPRLSSSTSPSLISMANMALGTGSSVRTMHDPPPYPPPPIGQDMSRNDHHMGNMSFKDALVQFAKLGPGGSAASSRNSSSVSSAPYPEVTLHPVGAPPNSSSLLHGILTKGPAPAHSKPATFSPTLARLLTAPDPRPQPAHQNSHVQRPMVDINDTLKILTSKKSRTDITITPVAGNAIPKAKEEVVLLDDDEDASGGDRLVIDEGPDGASDDVPQCQGCRQKSAQFVCAGCGNQWYCSRECQVTAWEEHSDVCSG